MLTSPGIPILVFFAHFCQAMAQAPFTIKANFAYTARSDNEANLLAGQTYTVLQTDGGANVWWQIKDHSGKVGWIPANYAAITTESSAPQPPAPTHTTPAQGQSQNPFKTTPQQPTQPTTTNTTPAQTTATTQASTTAATPKPAQTQPAQTTSQQPAKGPVMNAHPVCI
jgi:uncharacterized protein YgiM (DUF1202 family)